MYPVIPEQKRKCTNMVLMLDEPHLLYRYQSVLWGRRSNLHFSEHEVGEIPWGSELVYNSPSITIEPPIYVFSEALA